MTIEKMGDKEKHSKNSSGVVDKLIMQAEWGSDTEHEETW